jgi:hypothetical protein
MHRKQYQLAILATLIGATCELAVLALFGSGGGDDSHITWWVVDELARTGHIVNLNQQALEQSSSLALVVIAGALRRLLPFSTPAIGVVLSLLAAVGASWMSARVARHFDPRLQIPTAALVGTSTPLAYWGTSGMETAIAAFASVWLIDALLLDRAKTQTEPNARPWHVTANLLGAVLLFVSVRPENTLLVVGILGLTCFMTATTKGGELRNAISDLGAGLIASVALVSSLFFYRRLSFHEWFPHPVSMKTGGHAHWSEGAHYLYSQSLAWSPLLLVAVPVCLALVVWLWTRDEVTLPLALVFAEAACAVSFVAASGGDWMGAGRFLVPALPACWLLVLIIATKFVHERFVFVWVGIAVALAVNVGTLVKLAKSKEANGYPLVAATRVVPAARARYALGKYSFLELANKSHLRDALVSEELKRIIQQALAKKRAPLWLASGQAGAVPYHVFQAFPGQLRFIDFWGLTTAELLPCVAGRARHTPLGLTISLDMLFQNLAEIEDRCKVPVPDIIFNNSLRAATRKQLEGYGYRVVYFQKGAMRSFQAADSEFVGGTHMDTYIAVRRELADSLQLSYREVRWDIAG